MKNLCLASIAMLMLISFSVAAQTIRRVNNNDGVTGTNVYATIQAAHDAASNGDIILVEPSKTSYGELKCSKNLKIYGNGYWLDGKNLKANSLSSTVSYVEFVPGSSGSEIYGCSMINLSTNAVSNIVVSRNYVRNIHIGSRYSPSIGAAQYAQVSNIVITQNFVYQDTNGSGINVSGSSNNSTDYLVSNYSITNNKVCYLDAYYLVNNGIVKNNVIMPGSSFGVKLKSCIFENNIIIPGTNVAFDVTEPVSGANTALNSSLNYNISSDNLFPVGVGTGNQNNVDLSLHFVASVSTLSEDTGFKLRDDSSLKTAGTGGTEVGMFGGTTPYVISGIPAIPSITNLKTTGTGTNTVPITVTFSAKSN